MPCPGTDGSQRLPYGTGGWDKPCIREFELNLCHGASLGDGKCAPHARHATRVR